MIHHRLKTETRPHHDATEDVAYSREIMSGRLSAESYKDLIIKNFLVHKAAENCLSAFPEIMEDTTLDFNNRRKTPALERDLKTLNIQEKELPDFKLSSLPKNGFEALGALYVFEGATLGGAVILKQLMKQDDIAALGAFNYYGIYGPKIGQNWKSFLGILEEKAINKEVEDEILNGARLGYQWVSDVFSLEPITA